MLKTICLVAIAFPLVAEQPLSLAGAVKLALTRHPAVEASTAGLEAADERVREARAGYLPKVNYSETWLRSNNPVVVFGSLLTQHQFTAANFELGPLNRPEALDNFQSLLTADQVVYDGGQTKLAVKSAKLGKDLSTEERRATDMKVIAGVVRSYETALLAQQSLAVAIEAVRSAEADLDRAVSIRTAGMATDADVLSIKVHLAAMREQQISGEAGLDVALAALDDALGLPLTGRYTLTTALAPAQLTERNVTAYAAEGRDFRPELRQAKLSTSLAETQQALARSSLLPEVVLHADFEADRQTFADRGGANWVGSASFRWNLFDGGSDRARIEVAKHDVERAHALSAQANSQVELQVRRAYADYRAAAQRIDVANAAVAMAEESLRITKNRYEAGLSNVTDLLRTETALLEARNHQLAAVYDQRIAAVNLELSSGTLTPNSEVLN